MTGVDTRITACRWCRRECYSWQRLQHHINTDHPLAGSGLPGDPALWEPGPLPTSAELDELLAKHARANNDCDACGGTMSPCIPGILIPAGNDDNHLFVQACDACTSRGPRYGYPDFDDDDACREAALRLGWHVHRRYDDATLLNWRSFICPPGAWDDRDYYSLGADEYGWDPATEIPVTTAPAPIGR